MREIKLGDTVVAVRATPLALLYYRQAFKSDLLGSLVKMKGIEKDLSKLDFVTFLQMIWAMAKANLALGATFPGFEAWLATLDSLDISDPELLVAVMEEAEEGFFRGGRNRK